MLAYEIVTGKVPYNELGDITSFMLATKVMSGYRPKFAPNVPEKMQKLIEKCWSDKPSDRPSFDYIFKTLSSDFSYLDEAVDEEGIGMYTSTLNEEGRDRKDMKAAELESIVVSLQSQINELKGKCRGYEILQSTDERFIYGLEKIHGTEANISSLEQSSERCNCYASYLLGFLYEGRKVVSSDPQKSLAFYGKSGQQGFKRIPNYGEGRGVEQSYEKANEYYQKVIDRGNTNTKNYLSIFCEEGIGVEQNYKKAIEYYQKAIDLGDSDAMNNLGDLNKKRRGFKQSYEKAVEYYKKASLYRNDNAIKNLYNLYHEGKISQTEYSGIN